MSAIVKPDERPVEQWYMLATGRAARPGWRALATRGGSYFELWPQPLQPRPSRTQLLDDIRLLLDRSASIRRLYAKYLFLAVNYDTMVIGGSQPAPDTNEYIPLWPRKMPLCGNAEEATGRLHVLLGAEPEFARRFARFRFVPVRFDDAIFNEGQA